MPNASLDLSAARMQSGSVRETPQAKSSTSLTLAAMRLGYGVVQLDVTLDHAAVADAPRLWVGAPHRRQRNHRAQQHRLAARWRGGRSAMGGQRLHHRV